MIGDRHNTGKIVSPRRQSTRGEAMAFYDQLPTAFRIFVANAPYNYSPQSILDLIRRKGERGALEEIMRKNAEYFRNEVKSAYGPDHPALTRGEKK